MRFLKKLLNKQTKPKKDIFTYNGIDHDDYHHIKDLYDDNIDFVTSLMYVSDYTNTIYPACAACYNISSNKNITREERLDYIGRRVKSKHTSITEHSNVLVQVYIPLERTKDDIHRFANKYNSNVVADLSTINTIKGKDLLTTISEVRDCCRYLTIVTDYIGNTSDDVKVLRLTLGGSIRSFRYIFDTIENRENRLFLSIFEVLKLGIDKNLFVDYINSGSIKSYETISVDDNIKNNIRLNSKTITNELIDIINIDSISEISNILKLDKDKCLDFVSITVNFKNMSRVITQQLTRHRNGITQESQRYVNYNGHKVNSPADFKDKYDTNKKYVTSIGEYTFEELGDILSKVYGELVSQGVDKEDARGYLPQNIQCGKLFITFNLRTLLNFLYLRTDVHAQAEIRHYATLLGKIVENGVKDLNNGLLNIDELADVYSKTFPDSAIIKYAINNEYYEDIE